MGRINQLTPTTTLSANSVIAMDAESGGATNKVTIQTLAAGLRSFGNYATQTDLNRKQDVLTFDDSPEEDSDNPVTSGGIYNAIGSAMSNVYTKAETDNAIAQSTAYSEGDIATRTYTSDSNASIAKVRKYGNHVWIDLQMSFTNSRKLPTATAGATVPAGFRPTSLAYIPALLEANNSQNWIPYRILVDTDGTIKQDFSSSCTGIAILSSGYCI